MMFGFSGRCTALCSPDRPTFTRMDTRPPLRQRKHSQEELGSLAGVVGTGRAARNSFITPSHNRSGSRLPAFASSMILYFLGKVTAIGKSQRYQGHFESEAHDPDRLRIEFLAF